jgi:hypothetical protein
VALKKRRFLKKHFAKSGSKETDQGYAVSLESLSRELIVVARLTV